MLARLVRELPGAGHVFEPNREGFRCLAFRAGDGVDGLVPLNEPHGFEATKAFARAVATALAAEDRAA